MHKTVSFLKVKIEKMISDSNKNEEHLQTLLLQIYNRYLRMEKNIEDGIEKKFYDLSILKIEFS